MIIDYDKSPVYRREYRNSVTANFLRKQFLNYLKIVGISLHVTV